VNHAVFEIEFDRRLIDSKKDFSQTKLPMIVLLGIGYVFAISEIYRESKFS